MTQKFSSIYLADLRLTMLQILAASECEVNVSILKHSIIEVTRHRPSGDEVRAEIAWLAERGLVHKRAIGATIEAATITERGEDAATGRAQIHGVLPPDSEDE